MGRRIDIQTYRLKQWKQWRGWMADCMTLETCDPERLTIGLWPRPMSGMAQILLNTKYTIAQKITSCLGANPLFLDPSHI